MTTVPPFWLALPIDARSTVPSFTTTTMEMNAGTDVLEFLIQAPVAGDITAVGYLTGTVTTGCTLDVRVESYNFTTGRGSGTLVSTNSNGSRVIANTDDNVWITTTLTSAATVTKGQFISIKFAVSSGTPSALRIVGFADSGVVGSFPACLEDDGTPALAAAVPVVALSYGGTYYPVIGCYPMQGVNTRSFNTGTNPDTGGIRFQIPYEARFCGLWFWGDVDGDLEIDLLSDAGSSLGSLTWDKDLPYADSGEGLHYVQFSSAVTLSAATWYRLVFRAREATSFALYTMTAASTAVMAAMPLGANAYYTTSDYSSPTYGTFTDTTTEVPFMGLCFDGIELGGGGGSAAFAPVGGSFIRGLGVV